MPSVQSPPTACLKCGGTEFYDNRDDKPSAKSPDFRCKKKDCREPYWLDEKETAPGVFRASPVIHPTARGVPPIEQVEREERATLKALLATPSDLTLKQLAVQYGECLDQALLFQPVLDRSQVGSDPQAIVAIASTLFIERRRRGI